MLVRVLLFAIARERFGRPSVEVEIPPGATAADLRSALARSSPALATVAPICRVAINAEYVDDASMIPEGAEVALIPPVSGGSPES